MGNRLADETSPYLRQHRDNPVDWYPWGDEAFAKAKAEDKPIMLSVGYSACHWCHVMAHESFENPAVAEVMNRLFVNVKVDREERPDVDSIYMTAVQAMTGRGGWPMTVFMDPAGRPFFGGTYFPPTDRHGLPGFGKILEAIDDAWRNKRDELDEQAAKLVDTMTRSTQLPAGQSDLDESLLTQAVGQLASTFDARFGGFGGAPKFPQAMILDLLLRIHVRTGDAQALEMAVTTLDAMAAGGMYDQLGGGFHRYSVDEFWLVPHFEKMLYDQATLTRAYLHAYQVTGDERHKRIVEETIGFVLRDMTDGRGGFYSAEDADTEGVEGRFYVWSLSEVAEVVGEEDLDACVRYWGLTEGGNFAGEGGVPQGTGANILHARRRGVDRPEAVERGRQKLFKARKRRVWPGLDDKVLTGWNGLFLQVLAEAAGALGREDWLAVARRNAAFLLSELRRDPGQDADDAHPGGRVLRSWQSDAKEARVLGYAEDYAALLGALVTMAEVDEVDWLDEAQQIADGLIDLFQGEDGAFFTTGHDAEALITRPRDVFDNATPSANSLAAAALLRLAALTGVARYEEAAVKTLQAVGRLMGEHPTAFAELLGALDRHLGPPLEIAIIGAHGSPATHALIDEVRRRFLPTAVALAAAPGEGVELSPLLAERGLVDGKPAAYVCERFACRQPVTRPAELAAQLPSLPGGD